MPPGDEPTAESFESEATELLESIGRARKKVEGIAGVLDGTLDRYRERIDRLIRESEVDNWRQVRIFTRDVETIAADLGKAVKEKRLSPRLVAWLDAALRKARRRDFYGARKAWRRLDRIAEQGAEVRRLQGRYREAQRAGHGRHFGQKQRARVYGERSQHQNVAPVWKCGVPAQYGEQTNHQHSGGDQQMFHTPGVDDERLSRHLTVPEAQGGEPEPCAEKDKQRRELPE